MTAGDAPSTIVVIPAFNEEASLPAVLADLAATVPTFDVVVVDDGSSDRTAEVVRSHGVTCVQLPYNLGIGGALRAGFRYADEAGHERAVQFDADGQHQADQIQRLLERLDRGDADMVIGSRFAESGDYDVGRSRSLAMGSLRWGVRVLTGRRFTDTSSGFRAIAQPLLHSFAQDYPVEYMDSVETLVSACRAGYRVVEVPVRMEQRTAGVASNRNLRLVYHYARLIVALIGANRSPMPTAPNAGASN